MEGRDDVSSLSLELAETGRSISSSFPHSSITTSDVEFTKEKNDDELELQWAAIERLPTLERLRTSLFDCKIPGDDGKNVKQGKRVTDLTRLGALERRMFIDKLIKNIEQDKHQLLKKLHCGTPSEAIFLMTLLLGPPGCGKTTFLQALAGKLREPLKEFVNEVLQTTELSEIKEALVGIPGVGGISTEKRKRLTIAVELVSNPSIIFMDEPTSGLDARAAAVVMRAVKNVVSSRRTIVKG